MALRIAMLIRVSHVYDNSWLCSMYAVTIVKCFIVWVTQGHTNSMFLHRDVLGSPRFLIYIKQRRACDGALTASPIDSVFASNFPHAEEFYQRRVAVRHFVNGWGRRDCLLLNGYKRLKTVKQLLAP